MPFELVMSVNDIADKQPHVKKEAGLQRKSKEAHSSRKNILRLCLTPKRKRYKRGKGAN